MREADAEPLREAVAEAKLGSARETLLLHEAERWRDALLADDEALDALDARAPDCDAQHLRSLVRAARREAAACRPSSASRAACASCSSSSARSWSRPPHERTSIP